MSGGVRTTTSTFAVEAELVEHAAVGLEVGEVVLLLQTRVAAELRRPDAVALEPLGRDRLRHEDARRGAAAELVLDRGELVVEGRRARDPEPRAASVSSCEP